MSIIVSNRLYNTNSRPGNKLLKGDFKVSRIIISAIEEIIATKK